MQFEIQTLNMNFSPNLVSIKKLEDKQKKDDSITFNVTFNQLQMYLDFSTKKKLPFNRSIFIGIQMNFHL